MEREREKEGHTAHIFLFLGATLRQITRARERQRIRGPLETIPSRRLRISRKLENYTYIDSRRRLSLARMYISRNARFDARAYFDGETFYSSRGVDFNRKKLH